MREQDLLKQQVAAAAMAYIPENSIIGVGTGSTVEFFIAELAKIKHKIKGAVASSERTAKKLKDHGIEIYELTEIPNLAIYFDGADEANHYGHLIKGGGGALTREKILAASSQKFICMIDGSKLVTMLGNFPLPVEVIPMARSLAGRELVKLGGDPKYRAGFVTDNGNIILDVAHLKILDPIKLEEQINHIPGVVSNGIFAKRPADVLLVASANGVKTLPE